MKKNEVRHGNLVIYGGHQTTIDEKEIIHFVRFSDKYEPIPLTEEWLLKFGFTLYPSGSYCIDLFNTDNYLAFDIKYNKDFVYLNIETESIKIDCHYVHQLQNLYFALTGEELTI